MRHSLKALKTLIYTNVGSYTVTTVAATTDVTIEVWGVINQSDSDNNVSDTVGAMILLAPANTVIMLESPILVAKGRGVILGGADMQLFYTVVDNTVASGAY
jgi:hypothetical protein